METFFIVQVSYGEDRWHDSLSVRKHFTNAHDARNAIIELVETSRPYGGLRGRRYRVARVTTTTTVVYADVQENLNPVTVSSV